jgi:2-methylcitrate dehydratase PrpD
MDIAYSIVEHVAAVEYDQLPNDAIEGAKRDILDTLGTVLAGSAAPGARELFEQLQDWGGKPESTVLVYGDRLPSAHAALANSAMAHARDYDDTHDAAVLHAGISVVPSSLAIAELVGGVSGRAFLTAVALGVDLMCRLGLACKQGPVESGWIYSATLSYFGATVAAGKLLGLSREQMLNALGIAYSQTAGAHQATRDGALTKRMQPAFGARAAVLSVLLARRGVTGSRETFEGIDGYFPVYQRNQYEREVILQDLGRRFEVANLSYKPYPCCRYTHAPIDAALDLRARGLRPEDVREIRARLGSQAFSAVGQPLELKQRPKSIVDSQFSVPYTVAAALLKGAVTIEDFTTAGIADEQVLALASRVVTMVDPEIDRVAGREISPTVLDVTTTDGRTLTSRIEYSKGHPNNPMSWDELAAKFRNCARHAARPLEPSAVESTIQFVADLETASGATILADRLVARSEPAVVGARA